MAQSTSATLRVHAAGRLRIAVQDDAAAFKVQQHGTAVREQPGHTSTPLPEAINVSASYGVTVLNGAGPAAQPFVNFLLSAPGQALLLRQGFAPR
ncbi:MAG: hypothetical protein CFE45_39015 [Burkholderiales bacterium PBB5]|nr:MAG: hypothetical protein CFE45_39015 [Burkholderiales bacterium PBB5]